MPKQTLSDALGNMGVDGDEFMYHEIKALRARIATLTEEKAALVDALRELLASPIGNCGGYHHAKHERHNGITPCPVEERVEEARHKAKAALKLAEGKK